MKTAGFVDAICRVLTAELLKSNKRRRRFLWNNLSIQSQQVLQKFFFHPEAYSFHPQPRHIFKDLAS